MSATFNLLTTLFGISAHMAWAFWRVCVLCWICEVSSSSLAPSAVKVLRRIQWSRLFHYNRSSCGGSLLLGILPPGGAGSYCGCGAPLPCTAVAAFSHKVASWKKKHSSSSSLFFIEKLVQEPGQVNFGLISNEVHVNVAEKCIYIITRQRRVRFIHEEIFFKQTFRLTALNDVSPAVFCLPDCPSISWSVHLHLQPQIPSNHSCSSVKTKHLVQHQKPRPQHLSHTTIAMQKYVISFSKLFYS